MINSNSKVYLIGECPTKYAGHRSHTLRVLNVGQRKSGKRVRKLEELPAIKSYLLSKPIFVL